MQRKELTVRNGGVSTPLLKRTRWWLTVASEKAGYGIFQVLNRLLNMEFYIPIGSGQFTPTLRCRVPALFFEEGLVKGEVTDTVFLNPDFLAKQAFNPVCFETHVAK